MFCAEDQVSGNYLVSNDSLIVIDVVEEQVERGDTLYQAAFKVGPLSSWNDPWNQVKRKNAFDALLLLAVDSERNALIEERDVSVATTFVERLGRHLGKHFMQSTIMRSRFSGGGEHFIEEIADFVVVI